MTFSRMILSSTRDGTAANPRQFGDGATTSVTMSESIECSGFESNIGECVHNKQFGVDVDTLRRCWRNLHGWVTYRV